MSDEKAPTTLREAGKSPLLEVHLPSAQRGKRTVLTEVHFELEAGEVLFVVGPNGSGKSTLLDVCLDLVPARGVDVVYSGRTLASLPYAERPSWMALVGREESDALGFSVDEVLSLACSEPLGFAISQLCAERSALWLTPEFLSRKLAHLSQGERQRVHILRGFLQDAKVLFWDEATAHLDLAHREEALLAVRSYASQGHAAVVVVHEIELALRHADRVLVLREGRTVALGSPRACFNRDLLRDVFGLRAEVVEHEDAFQLRWER